MVLNSLRSYRQMFSNEYGELVIACDNTNYWRKKVFPYYKANRKKTQEKSELNWKQIYECLNNIRSELDEFLPYKLVFIESVEADDIIATLTKKYGDTKEPILILSGDKDFIQLHTYSNVKQYDPTRKKWIKHANPVQFLKEHIIKGDTSDGIPNILSPDNCFVIGERQKPLTTKRMDHYLNLDPSQYDEVISKNYQRNAQLIDLKYIPDEIRDKILDDYSNQANRNRTKLMTYFMEKRLRNLMEKIGEF